MSKILFFSTIIDDWGGSEELWAKSIPYLQLNNNEIYVAKNKINKSLPQFENLKKTQVKLVDFSSFSDKIFFFIFKSIRLLLNEIYQFNTFKIHENSIYLSKIKKIKPDLVIVNQGINFDGLEICYKLYTNNIPYVIISHKAVDFYWPPQELKLEMKIALTNAIYTCFVSKNNLQLTEEQFGIRLKNSVIVYNPIKNIKISPYPTTINGFKLACIGRLFLIDKGQDILIKIFSQEKWKNRNIELTFYGIGPDEIALKELAQLLNVTKIVFSVYDNDLSKIWETHHALISASRSEGMALVVIEAMVAQRTVIVTNAGGNTDLIEHGINGFLGVADVLAFEKTLEEAWNNRELWQEMGINAEKKLKKEYIANGDEKFAQLMIEILNQK